MKCDNCAQELQIGDWPFCPHGSTTMTSSFTDKPIVVYKDGSGNVQFPGRADEKLPKRLAKLGFEKVEMTPHEARRFGKQMNSLERIKMEKHLSAMQAAYAHVHKEQREELRVAMRHMSPLGRDLAQAAIERADREEGSKYYTSDPGFRIEILE